MNEDPDCKLDLFIVTHEGDFVEEEAETSENSDVTSVEGIDGSDDADPTPSPFVLLQL